MPTTARSHRHVLTPWSKQGAINSPTMTHGQGSFIHDDAGKRYLDLSAGLVAVNIGHSHPAVVEAIKKQAERLCYVSPAMMNDTRSEFAELLSDISPWSEGARTFFTTGGGEANEDAIKMARMITGRHKVLAGYRSFHGSAPGAGTLTGEDRRWANEPGIPGVVHFFTPYPYRSPFDTEDPAEETRRALAHLELTIMFEGPQNIAALLIEPVVGSNGVIIYSEGYLEGLRRLTSEHGIVLIFDEVMTGFGRTGDVFAATRFNVTPDMITLAKGVASAYVPLGGVLVREGLASFFDDEALMCGHTYAGHPLAMAAGLENIRVMQREGLFTRARELESRLLHGLNELKDRHEVIGDVRGIGAFFALEFVRDRATREPLVPWYGGDNSAMGTLTAALRKEGVYAFGRYNVLLVTPPLVIESDELELGFEALDRALPSIAI
jgi:taurine--2-oxoglutarate transaminase